MIIWSVLLIWWKSMCLNIVEMYMYKDEYVYVKIY